MRIKKLSNILRKNQFPDGLIQKVVNGYLDNINKSTALSAVSTSPIGLCTLYFKLPYLPWSNFTKRKLQTLVKHYCKDLKIKLVFSSFTSKNLIDVKESLPKTLRSNVVYKVTCAGCDSVYVGETSRHLSTRVREHLQTDKNSNIFKHLRGSDKCRESCSDNCVTVIDTASTYHQRKIKEALHISWEKPILNKQVQHFDISLSF